MDNAANSLHLRDASFSAYLSTAEENFAVKLAESIQSPYLPLTSTQEAAYPVNLGRTMCEEGELSVFGAEKYFNMKMDDGRRRLTTSSSLKHRQIKEDRADLHCTKPKIRPGTPSASSEASWNSHAALLPRLLRNPSPSKQRKANAKMIFAGFGCNGSCSDKKSVYVDTNAEPGGVHGKEIRKKVAQNDPNPLMLDRTRLSQPGFPVKNEIHSRSFDKASIGFKREEYFGYPIINSGLESLTVKGELVNKRAEEEGRKSLEVFGSHMLKKGDVATNLERKLSVLTWDAIPKVQTVPTTSEGTGMYEDNESDASSDLFEIENLSGSAHPLFNRQASDGMSSCTRYEPSEASIEWSVVTASAADFSVTSDFDEKKQVESTENSREMNFASTPTRPSKTKSSVGKEAQRSRPTGLLGCRSDKAVRVSEPAYRTNDKVKSDPGWHHRLDSSMPLGKSQGENKVKDFEFPQAQHAFA
ncbi:hypothetical protein PVL29_022400 [Vitis rotundifolia]|uniref:Protein PHYTOCHROME KINASE SUBSTRATE 1-like n=1 Tax=Vitis rotundifolia TaxID=103349 RepID=A0AA38YVW1_VITRO|nr:hypothetical protein PVL29_022400 [Vitis rotundifolia]